MGRTLLVAVLLVSALSSAPAGASQSQSEIEAWPAFEVVSIKPQPNERARGIPSTSTRYNQTNATLESLILQVYELLRPQLLGAPAWAATSHFEFVGVAKEPVSLEQRRLMVKRALADRFGLRAHKEIREQPIYALAMARSDRALGPDMRPSTVDCPRIRADLARGVSLSQEDIEACTRFTVRLSVGSVTRQFRGETMPNLARTLSSMLGRMVVDKTALAGSFDMVLKSAADQMSFGAPLPPVPAGQEGISIFTAVQEQLGLKLESQRAPVEVLVIDSVELPTPN